MTNLLAGLLGVLLATNQVSAATNFVAQTTGITVPVVNTNDPVEKEYQKLLAADDAAQAEVDQWIRQNNEFKAKGAGVPATELNARIRNRFDPVLKGYEDFIKKHPDHERVRLAYGSFLSDIRREDDAVPQFEKARELNPKDPAPWNQLANYYGEHGPIKKAFEYYEKAIELNPNEAVYYQNLGTTVYLFRKDSKEYYHLNEQQIFDKALALYDKALKLDSHNFDLAQDVAQTYYGIRPPRTEEALKAWTNCLNIAQTQVEREGVYLHFARWKLNAGRFAEAHHDLNMVTNALYDDLKARLLRNLKAREENPDGTNAPVTKTATIQSSETNKPTTKP
ncbi:MAG TPA: hypothetical protein VFB72_06065 [Verrucomicrobiae bacterium]|nr:hypothetical protein [Verrucomicrobiae bacterium]